VLGQSSPQENDNVQHKFPQIKSSAHFPSRRWKDLLISNAHEFWRAGKGGKNGKRFGKNIIIQNEPMPGRRLKSKSWENGCCWVINKNPEGGGKNEICYEKCVTNFREESRRAEKSWSRMSRFGNRFVTSKKGFGSMSTDRRIDGLRWDSHGVRDRGPWTFRGRWCV